MKDNYLIQVLQEIIQDNVKGLKPTELCYGTVISVSPLSVQLQNTMQNLPAAALVETVGVRYKQADVIGGEGGYVIINEGLSVGDKVVMLQVMQGQRYILLSKV